MDRDAAPAAAPSPGAAWLVLLMFLMGATAVIAQSLYVREVLVAFFGNELSLGVVFAGWLLGVSAGALVGGRVAARAAEPVLWLAAAAVVGAVTLPGGLIAARALRLIAAAEPGGYLPFHWLIPGAALVTVPFSLIIGFTFPLACSLKPRPLGAGKGDIPHFCEAPFGPPVTGNEECPLFRPGGTDRAISLVYIAEAFGAVAGGLLFSFALVGRWNAFRIGMTMAALVVCAATWPLTSRRRGPKGLTAILVEIGPAVLFTLLALRASDPLDRWASGLRWRGIAPGQALVASAEGPYGHVALGRLEDQYTLYLDGHLASVFPDPRAMSHAAHLLLTQHPDPKRVLVIGGGMEGLLAPILRHPVTSVAYVQLDPTLLGLLEDYLPPADREALGDPRVAALLTDGRSLVRAAGGALQCDAVVLNVPAPANAALNRYYTAEFLREVRRILAPGGILAVKLPAAGPEYRGREALDYTGSVFHTLGDAFRHVVVKPDPDTLWFFAADRPDVVTDEPAVLARRYRDAQVSDPFFDPLAFEADFRPIEVARLRRDLAQHADVPRNTDEHPVTYFYDTILWGRYSDSRGLGGLAVFERLSPWLVMGGCGTAVLVWLVLRLVSAGWRRRAPAVAAIAAVALVGFAALALELLLLFAYQNLFGVLYQQIGAAVGLFMAGLAAGGLLSRTVLQRRSVPAQGEGKRGGLTSGLGGAACVAAALALLSLFLPVLLRWLARGSLTGAWTEAPLLGLLALVGGLTGAMFPVAGRVHLAARSGGPEVARTAGALDAADHLGACLGALLTGVVLAPVLGVGRTALIVAALAATAPAFLLLSWSRRSLT